LTYIDNNATGTFFYTVALLHNIVKKTKKKDHAYKKKSRKWRQKEVNQPRGSEKRKQFTLKVKKWAKKGVRKRAPFLLRLSVKHKEIRISYIYLFTGLIIRSTIYSTIFQIVNWCLSQW